jgi:hypothetical protein
LHRIVDSRDRSGADAYAGSSPESGFSGCIQHIEKASVFCPGPVWQAAGIELHIGEIDGQY